MVYQPMRRKRIDYQKLYREFLASSHVELTAFLIVKKMIPEGGGLGHLGGNQRERLQGWQELKKHELDLAKIEAKNSIREKNAPKWKEILEEVEEAEITAINIFIDAVHRGFPIYQTNEQEHLVLDENGERILLGYRPLTFNESLKVIDLMRKLQGKDKNYIPVFQQNSDPMRDKLNEIMEMEALEDEIYARISVKKNC